jgi:A/G-specific adenine glycosylase
VTAHVRQLVSAREAFRPALLAWYDAHRRRLPWREEPEVYKTVVSEFMLQQTQVKTVLPYFARWMEALPDFAALAAAPSDRVLKLWEGLGYYSRARNLHRLAQAVVALPALPRTPAGWRELPGVGPYTAAAIASIAFGEPAACVDGNVVRILARLTADATPHRDSASASKAFAPLAGELVDPARPGDYNQAVMELGATICHRKSPLCTVCPVLDFCAARRQGDPEAYPRLAPKQIERRTVHRAWCVQEGRLLLHRTESGARRLAGVHELPPAEALGVDPSALAEDKALARRKRGITRYAITEYIHALETPPRQTDPGLVWIPVDEVDRLVLSGPHRRWVKELLATAPSPRREAKEI